MRSWIMMTDEFERMLCDRDSEIGYLRAELAAANEERESWRRVAERLEGEKVAAREISTLLERERDAARGRAADAETRLAAANERVELQMRLLRDIADDATDGPINRGLNSVQAVLDLLDHEPPALRVDW